MVKSLKWVSLSACICALGVIALGAFTRLIDAGLGCPDWPGCYGHLTVPTNQLTQELINLANPETPLVAYKAWAEMVHRYLVGGLSLLILGVIFLIFFNQSNRNKINISFACGLIALLIYQILLGRWTVTLKLLPVVVTQHLLGGFLILTLLWLIYLFSLKKNNSGIRSPLLFSLTMIGLLLLFMQISLGAWTSTHYASLSCPDFPFCNHRQSVSMNWREAFTLSAPLGINYEGGVLADAIRQTIHMTHRLGAFIFTVYGLFLIFVVLRLFPKEKAMLQKIYIFGGLLTLQICLGLTNVIFKLPLLVAIAHNLVAVLLVLTLVSLLVQR